LISLIFSEKLLNDTPISLSDAINLPFLAKSTWPTTVFLSDLNLNDK
jgi:hypothetical protein